MQQQQQFYKPETMLGSSKNILNCRHLNAEPFSYLVKAT
jgi:hypothetical protein